MKKIILSPSNTTIEIEDYETVLSGLEKHGHVLPNNCRAGACGECKVKVVEGSYDQGFILDMALSAEDRANGLGLMCMAKVTSESLTIEFEQNSTLQKLPTPQENLIFILTEKQMMTNNLVKLRMRPLRSELRFWPGQYVSVGFPNDDIPFRSYSIANTPNMDSEIVLYVSRVENGITSNYIHDKLTPGDYVTVSGPYGTFIGDPKVQLPVLCISHGSGLAPIMGLATAALLRGGFKFPAHILFSAKTKSDIFELGHFKFLERKFRNFKFIPTLTKENDPEFKNGRVTEILPTIYPELSNYSLYIAGSNQFVSDVKDVCLKLGAKEENIHLEKFNS